VSGGSWLGVDGLVRWGIFGVGRVGVGMDTPCHLSAEFSADGLGLVGMTACLPVRLGLVVMDRLAG
jgi:hypothetical protein